MRYVFKLRVALAPWTLLALLSFGNVAAAQDRLQVGTRVEVDGHWSRGQFRAIKVVVEEPDEYPEVKGFADTIDLERRRLTIGPFTIEIDDDTDIEDAEDGDDSYRFDELRPEWRLKVEGELIGPLRMRAVVIDVDQSRTRTDPPILELEGVIEARRMATDGGLSVTVNGVICMVTPETGLPDGVFQKTRVQIDDDDDRPQHQLVLWDRFTIGGEVQIDFEYEDDFDLDKHRNGDIFQFDTSATIEGLFDLGARSYAFAKVRTAKGYVIFDEDRDKKLREQSALEELNVYWYEPFGIPVSLHIGRQDFDEEREWLYDENLDAVRFMFRRGPWEAELSWSGYLADAPRHKDNLFNQIALVRWRYDSSSYLSAYVIDIQDRSRRDVSPLFLGARAYHRSSSMIYWCDYAYVDGVDGFNRVQGHGIDVGGGYQFRRAPARPYVYAAYALGTGDGKTSGRTDRSFRQTGYHDNNEKMFGVASFRYYGELFDPELSNLEVATVGVGCRPRENTSIDIVFHRYHQHRRSTTLRDSSLRASPGGTSRDLGSEIDIIVGVDDLWDHCDLEFDFGYFMPGDAFTADHHPALFAAVQIEWSF